MTFRDLPIRRKLLWLSLASSVPALVLASSGFLAWEITNFRREVRQDVETQAAIVADNSAAPLTFRDARAARETLAVLRLRPRVSLACLYAIDNGPFASYQRNGAQCPASPPAAVNAWGRYSMLAPVNLQGDRIGTLYIERDLDDVMTRLRIGALTVGVLLLVAVGASILISRRIQHFIAAPLVDLTATALAISTGADGQRRATPGSNDEVGVVIRAFNAMLDKIDERNTALSNANQHLAREVDERRRLEVERLAALERERDANRLKDEFLATLSHELRTPLNAVLGWTRILRTTNSEGAARERALDSIERNASAQARLVGDLLEISRIVTGKLRIRVERVDLAAIVDAAVDVMLPAAAAKRIALTTDVRIRPAIASGDPDRLQQVVWNLVSNAVKFTSGGGSVTVRLWRSDHFHIEVTDTGQGIEPRFLPHVFEAFRQADGTSSREHGGLGLGLAIARQLVQLHGGTIEARSEGRGCGSTFEVCLPSAFAAAPDGSESPALSLSTPSAARDAVTLHGIHVLVVDDQEDARELLQVTLEQYGATVTSVDSAAAALAHLDHERPDIVLSDIGMPRQDGYYLIRELRARPAATGGNIPAVAVTAYASSADRESLIAAGYQARVSKPFDPEELLSLTAALAVGRGPRM